METIWKITNTGKKEKVKFTIAIDSNRSPGVFLSTDEYILSKPRMTTMLDAQEKRGYVKIDKSYVNSSNEPIGSVLKLSQEELAKKNVAEYKG